MTDKDTNLRPSEGAYRAIFDAMDAAFCIIDLIRNEAGDAVDYVFRQVNAAFERHTGLGDVLGRRVNEVTPVLERYWLDLYGEVARTGRARGAERYHEGTDRWYEVHVSRLSVAPALVCVIFSDVTDRKRTEAALRESEERLRQFGEASRDVLWIRDAETLQWTYLTPVFEEIYGLSREEALRGDNFRYWLDLVVPADRAHAAATIDRVRAGESVTFEYRITRPSDGEIRWLRDTDFPVRDADGRVTMVGGIGEDVTDMRAARERLALNEERLRNAVEVGGVGLWDWDLTDDAVHWSPEEYRMHGFEVGEVEPSLAAWLANIHPKDQEGARARLEEARRTGKLYESEFRVVHRDGSIRWVAGRGRFFFDEAGRPVRMIGAMVDTTERREWEERQKVLVTELQHRTRNLMGVVRSMTEKTARASTDIADFVNRFRDRLEALSSVQALLSRLSEQDRVTFDELIRTELAAMDGDTERLLLEGPRGVRLRSSTVQIVAMALHELATNAVKYGALGQQHGHLAVRWRIERPDPAASPWLHIDWRESNVDMTPSSETGGGTGQGRELIEHALPYQLSAQTTYELTPDGVHCTITIPVSASTIEVPATA